MILQVAHPTLVQQVLHQHCDLLQPSCKLGRPPREKFSHTTITFRHVAARFRHVAARWSCLEPVALFDQLSHAGDRRAHVRDSGLCTHSVTFRSEPHAHSPRALSFNRVSLCVIRHATLGQSQRSS